MDGHAVRIERDDSPAGLAPSASRLPCTRCGCRQGIVRLASIDPDELGQSARAWATSDMDGIPVTRSDLVTRMMPPVEPRWQYSLRRDIAPCAAALVLGLVSCLALISPLARSITPDTAQSLLAMTVAMLVFGVLFASQIPRRFRHAPRRHGERVQQWLDAMAGWNRLHFCPSCADVFQAD